ncbi:hypothetical protein BpHYR1_026353 [Brachionus plicatilis]|uniref:Uncharacterized protein n=1 Tax=Brachionus plicatilis TaxID=10195 RepID=A0A3M7Q5Q8_BRAPC|nr:hypothetical protein BpHYR1_026353 [Brachionus plicatilis]
MNLLALKSTQNGADNINFANLFTDYKKINYSPFAFVRTQNGADNLNFPNLFTDYKNINYGPFAFVPLKSTVTPHSPRSPPRHF